MEVLLKMYIGGLIVLVVSQFNDGADWPITFWDEFSPWFSTTKIGKITAVLIYPLPLIIIPVMLALSCALKIDWDLISDTSKPPWQ